MSKKLTKQLLAAMGMAALAFGLFGCVTVKTAKSESADTSSRASSSAVQIDGGDSGTTDEMFNKKEKDAQLYVFQFDDDVWTVDGCYDVGSAGEPLKDGGFYKMVADVTFLNGGIAGYVNYPQIEQVKSYESVSPFDIGLPSIEEKIYGVVLIGDYADGDILLHEQGKKAVWKDGAWIYRYDKDMKLPDGTNALVRSGVSESDVQAGIERGVLSCEDYFVLPKVN